MGGKNYSYFQENLLETKTKPHFIEVYSALKMPTLEFNFQKTGKFHTFILAFLMGMPDRGVPLLQQMNYIR